MIPNVENTSTKERRGMLSLPTHSVINDVYDYAEFTVADSTTNYDVKSNIATLFKNVGIGRRVQIWVDQTISIRFNSTSMPAINPALFEQPYSFEDWVLIKNIYITNASGNLATIKVLMV